MSALPKVTVLSLGGTIASAGPAPGGGPGVVPSLGAEELVATVAGLGEVAQISARSLRRLPSTQLSVADVVEAAAEVLAAIASGAHGVVVVQGTDTMEETAFLLDLLVGGDAPVVVTGAMRHPALAGADGPANLWASVAVAASASARGLGTLVVMGDEIHAARFVTKAHTSNPGAFTSYPGIVGWLSEGRVRVVTRPVGRPRTFAPAPGADQRVGLASLAMDDDGGAVDGLVAAGVSGLVVEALGGGHVPPGALDSLSGAAADMPVVVTSATRHGDVLRATYGYTGAEIDLAGRGLIFGGWLDARKARLLLTVLLRCGARRDEIVETFAVPYR